MFHYLLTDRNGVLFKSVPQLKRCKKNNLLNEEKHKKKSGSVLLKLHTHVSTVFWDLSSGLLYKRREKHTQTICMQRENIRCGCCVRSGRCWLIYYFILKHVCYALEIRYCEFLFTIIPAGDFLWMYAVVTATYVLEATTHTQNKSMLSRILWARWFGIRL